MSGDLQVAASLERAQASQQHATPKVGILDSGCGAGKLTADSGLSFDLPQVVASPELANAQRQPIQVSSEPAQIGQVKLETGRNLPGKRQPDEAIQSRKRPRDSLRDLTSMGGPMQGDRQVVDFGDGHGSSLATDRAIRRQRHENGAALSRLAELEGVRVAWVGIPLRVARDVIVPEE